MDQADAAVGHAVVAFADLVLEVGGGEQGPLATVKVELSEAALEAALAAVQLVAYLGFHSKSLACRGEGKLHTLSNTADRSRDFEISDFFPVNDCPDVLV
jgi:hypothetical protein